MTGDPLDRWENAVNITVRRNRDSLGLGPEAVSAPASVSCADVLALVEVARAARRAERKLKVEYDRLSKRDGYDLPPDESWAEGELLADALSKLEAP